MSVQVGKYEIAINYIQGWTKEVPEEDKPNGGVVVGRPTNGGGVIIGWSAKRDGKAIGFGELTIADNGDSEFECDSESMSQEFCEAVLIALAKLWKVRA